MQPGIVLGVPGAGVAQVGDVARVSHPSEKMSVTILSYDAIQEGASSTIGDLKAALLNQGIVGVRGIPGYQELVRKYIEAARQFSYLPDAAKDSCAPNPNDFLGYELGKEKFSVVDESKASYYAYVPDIARNKWPKEPDLRTPFQNIGQLMIETGIQVMQKIGLIGGANAPTTLAPEHVGRMLCYRERSAIQSQNPHWCDEHKDHSSFTALLPAVYTKHHQPIPEPDEAGLFVKGTYDTIFRKVVSDDPDVMLFQVGEFGQLATNDAIHATAHRVDKPIDPAVERYTMALFFAPPMECEITSTSVLTQDSRYGTGKTCTYGRWHEESMKRYRA